MRADIALMTARKRHAILCKAFEGRPCRTQWTNDGRKVRQAMDGYRLLARNELPLDTVLLACQLIGKILVRETPEGSVSGRVVETEAHPVGDAAGHAYRGMTPRNRSLFLCRGHAYVYVAYGKFCMLNVVSEIAGVGAGILIRALGL